MPALGPVSWTVQDVCEWLKTELELPDAIVEEFKVNAVAGPDLLELSDEDLIQELNCKPLQARKIRNALQKMGFHAPGSEAAAAGGAAAAPAVSAPPPAAAPAPAPAPAVATPAPVSERTALEAPAGYPAPAAAGYPAPAPAPGYGGPPQSYYGPPPGAPGYYSPQTAAPPPEKTGPSTGAKVAGAVLLTAPRRMMRRGFIAANN